GDALEHRFEVRELGRLDDLVRLQEIFSEIWRREEAPPLSAELMRALAHSGNYVAGGYLEGRLVGGVVGFFGRLPGHALHLHSHILGVLPEQQLRGLGFAPKQPPRPWSPEPGTIGV